MSTRRVRLQSDSGSPIRISVAGVDANHAQFDDLLFDGDQIPLRRALTGVTTIGNIEAGNLAPAKYRAVALARTFPAIPIFSVYGRVTWVNATGGTEPSPVGPYRPYYSFPTSAPGGQIGGGCSTNTFYALNYIQNQNTTLVGTATIWYLIFNNTF